MSESIKSMLLELDQQGIKTCGDALDLIKQLESSLSQSEDSHSSMSKVVGKLEHENKALREKLAEAERQLREDQEFTTLYRKHLAKLVERDKQTHSADLELTELSTRVVLDLHDKVASLNTECNELTEKMAERDKLIAEDRENRELISKVVEQIREDIKSGKHPEIDLSATPENKE